MNIMAQRLFMKETVFIAKAFFFHLPVIMIRKFRSNLSAAPEFNSPVIDTASQILTSKSLPLQAPR